VESPLPAAGRADELHHVREKLLNKLIGVDCHESNNGMPLSGRGGARATRDRK
jgi:hypothetical protein